MLLGAEEQLNERLENIEPFQLMFPFRVFVVQKVNLDHDEGKCVLRVHLICTIYINNKRSNLTNYGKLDETTVFRQI